MHSCNFTSFLLQLAEKSFQLGAFAADLGVVDKKREKETKGEREEEDEKQVTARTLVANTGVIITLDCACVQACTHIFTPVNGSRRRTVHPHACMYTFMHVDMYTYITVRACGEI